MSRAYRTTTVDVYKTMGDLSSLVIAHRGQMSFTEADSGLSVDIAFPTRDATRWNYYRFTKRLEAEGFIRQFREEHPRTTIDGKRRAEIVAGERNRIARVLFHFIKNLFIAIDEGVIDLGEAFMPYLVIPDGPKKGFTLYEALGRPMEEGKLAATGGLLALAAPKEKDGAAR
jgi:hypothetical protein